jgi:hypothetical protein
MADDPLSPTTLVMNYLRAKGLQPNAQNIRAALTENARDPSLIPGLRNQSPPGAGEDNSSASPKASGPAVGQRGSAASRIENADSKPARTNGGGTENIENTGLSDAPKTSSAAPQQEASGGLPWDTILGLGATGAASLAGMKNAGGGGEFVGNAGPPPFGPQAGPDALPAPPQQPMIASDPMQAALAKATSDVPQAPMIGNAGGSGGAIVPSQSIPMPDATSGPVITPQNTGTGPTLVTPRTGAPMPDNMPNNPGMMEDFMRFIRGIGARR